MASNWGGLIIGSVMLVFGVVQLFRAEKVSRSQRQRPFLPSMMRRQMSPGLVRIGAGGLVVIAVVLIVTTLRM